MHAVTQIETHLTKKHSLPFFPIDLKTALVQVYLFIYLFAA